MKIADYVITSRKNPIVAATAALAEKKHRDESKLFLVEGEKLVLEAADRTLSVEYILVAEGKKNAVIPKLKERYGAQRYCDMPIYLLSDDCFSKISSEKAPQGVIAVIKHLDFFRRTTIIYDEDILFLRDRRILLLYAMQDPGNLGAVIRSAVAFGVECIVLSENCADLYNTKTIRAAMGSLFHIRAYVVSDFLHAIKTLQRMGRRVLAAELRDGAVSLADIALSSNDCVLIGNEGHGIPTSISEMCDSSVYLPISSGAESLNAAVAAGIFMWEQRER